MDDQLRKTQVGCFQRRRQNGCLRLKRGRQIQIAYVSNGVLQMTLENVSDLLAECWVFKNQGAYVRLAAMIDNQKTLARYQRVGMHIDESSNFPQNSCHFVSACLGPHRRPIAYAAIAH